MRQRLTHLARRAAVRFHRDEQGDEMVGKVLVLACVSIPLLLLLIVFGQEAAIWFHDTWTELRGEAGAALGG